MSEKGTQAKKKFWANKTPEQRSAHAKMMVKTRLSKLTLEQKKAWSKAMNEIKARLSTPTVESEPQE